MNIFTKMRQSLLVAAALLCAGGTFAQDYSPVWTNDFEDEATFSDGFASGNSGRYEVLQKEGYISESKSVGFSPIGNGSNGTTNSYNVPSSLASAFDSYKEEYQFDFYYYQQAGNNQTSSGIKMIFSTGVSVSLLTTATSGPAIISVNDVATDYSVPNKTWCRIYINSKDSQTKLTVTSVDGSTSYISDAVIAECADVLTKIENYTKRYYGEFRFDDMTLSAPGAKEDINDPSASITAVDGVKRIVTIVPGVGTLGTEAESTYYTTDGSVPSKTNGIKYEGPIEVSTTTVLNFISYLSDDVASNVMALEVEAGTEVSLSSEIINVLGFEENGDVFNPIVSYVYDKNKVLLSPEVELTVTFNGEKVDLPYTITEDGTIEATVTAAGYTTASESYALKASYYKTRAVDFTETDTTNVVELLGENWSVTMNTETGYCLDNRWGNWEKRDGVYHYYNASCNSTNLTDFLSTTNYGKSLLIGYGVGQNALNKDGSPKGTNYWISNASEGEIAIFEVNEAQRFVTSNLVTYGVVYSDDNTLGHTVYDCKVLAKVAVYSPARELTVTDGEDLTATGTYTSATYERLFNTDYTYGTICLPFAPDAATCANYTFYKLAEVNSEALYFEEETAPKANVAYLYKLNDGVDAESAKTFTGGVTTISDVEVESVGGWNFIGVFAKTKYEDLANSDGLYYAYTPTAEKDILTKATNSLTVHPYRAFFKFVETEELNFTPATATMRLIIPGQNDGGANSIEEVITPDQIDGAIFDLEGRPVQEMLDGQIYIIGGKKVMK